MVGMYPFPAIYDLGAMGQVNAELLHDPSIVYLNGQHVGFVQRNTTDQLEAHKETLTQIVRSTGCSKTWVVAGYSGENDPLMDALNELRPYNNWLYWLEYNERVLQKSSHQFLESDEECKVIYKADADNIFMQIADLLNCNLDFIESPDVELALYEREINFQTAGTKQNYFTKKIKHYRQLLSQPELIKLLEEVEDFNTSLILQGITQKIIHLCQSSDEEQMLELVKIGDIFKKQINLDDIQFQNFQKIPMLFANIFILAYEKNIAIDPKPLTDNGLLEFAWMFTDIAEKSKPDCSLEIRQRIKDLKTSIEI